MDVLAHPSPLISLCFPVLGERMGQGVGCFGWHERKMELTAHLRERYVLQLKISTKSYTQTHMCTHHSSTHMPTNRGIWRRDPFVLWSRCWKNNRSSDPSQNHIKKFDFCCSTAASFHLLICDVYVRKLQPGRVCRGEERREKAREEQTRQQEDRGQTLENSKFEKRGE